ncbi:hypothetical protein HYX12_04510 [Candidatus Woesearchaeota archaeon]|nr:hypothetical protein [Candidatus Woesearchaeota archaeon]
MVYRRSYVLFISLALLSIVLVGCKNISGTDELSFSTSEAGNSLSSCCQECLQQANRDPSGYDISIKPCSEYQLSEKCELLFETENRLVVEC